MDALPVLCSVTHAVQQLYETDTCTISLQLTAAQSGAVNYSVHLQLTTSAQHLRELILSKQFNAATIRYSCSC